MLEQPLGLVTIGMEMLTYAKAYATYERCRSSKQTCPPRIEALVLSIMRESTLP